MANWDKIDELTSEERQEAARKASAEKKAEVANLAQAFHRLFTSDDGQRVLQHLSNEFIINNDISFSSPNINYEAAYKNGEGGVIKYIISQISKAEVL